MGSSVHVKLGEYSSLNAQLQAVPLAAAAEPVESECLSETNCRQGVTITRGCEAVDADKKLRLLRVGDERPEQVADWEGLRFVAYPNKPAHSFWFTNFCRLHHNLYPLQSVDSPQLFVGCLASYRVIF